ncbi:zona pellucida sperm-binding protein 4-like isoform X2 [Myripristis murdjan]|uniref:zona pellucida sperm-binding protein 4-like isoform X2 n=1 Tax=Myripristis murdjan TaxID=586833 RepID=UPI0011761D4E|nr:zona pellucida sperm-binding protein 4-like isoform X2 [Myripristis murdjan]
MKTPTAHFFMVTFILLSMLFLKYDASAPPAQEDINHTAVICHEGFMSLYMSRMQFADLPFSVYVQDKGRVEIVQLVPLICRREIKEVIKNDNPPASRQFPCSKHGFNIIISQNATVPPLNMDTVRIPSGQSQNCKPNMNSTEMVTFSFPFTDCGAQFVIADGIITYSVTVEAKQLFQKGFIVRDAPFQLMVFCSFVLGRISQLVVKTEEVHLVHSSALESEGVLRAEMRFAKDSSYRSFFSSREPPVVTELGQPVYVEVFVLKLQNKGLELLLRDCWATPSKDPHDAQRWTLLLKGCPFSGDSQRAVLSPVISSKELTYPSLHKRFVFKLFSFVKPPAFQSLVYFHCDVEICKAPDCLQSCHSRRRRLDGIGPLPRQRNIPSVVSGGPIIHLVQPK